MTPIKRLLLIALLLGNPYTGHTEATGKALFYRYTNDNGVTVISSRIPPRYVPRGYDVINHNGSLVKQVPPEPSPAEKARLLEEYEQQARLQAWDDELLRRYSSVDDIESARE